MGSNKDVVLENRRILSVLVPHPLPDADFSISTEEIVRRIGKICFSEGEVDHDTRIIFAKELGLFIITGQQRCQKMSTESGICYAADRVEYVATLHKNLR